MSKKIVLGFVLLAGLAACQQQPQPQADVFVPTAPVTTEPVFTGKYGN